MIIFQNYLDAIKSKTVVMKKTSANMKQDWKYVAQNTRQKLFRYGRNQEQPLRYAGLKQEDISDDVYSQLILGNFETAKEYLKDFYDNQPVFEKLPPNYNQILDNPKWVLIAEYVISQDPKDNEKFLKIIQSS